MSRILTFVNLVAIASVLLSACGGGGSDTPTASSASASTVSPGSDSTAATADTPPMDSSANAAVTMALETTVGPERELGSTGAAVVAVGHATALSASPPQAVAAVVTSTQLAVSTGAATTDATATVYYVDNRIGSDSNSGTSATVSGTSGPFKSLKKVATLSLKAGDVVNLACGSVWSEPLKLLNSGSSAAPIRVAAYPAGCSTPPVIDGSMALAPNLWVKSSGNVYLAPFVPVFTESTNVLGNGGFDTGISGWTVWSSAGDGRLASRSGCSQGSCLAVTTATSAALVSSPSFAVSANTGYGIRYALNAPTGTRVRVLVRRAASPWETLGQDQTIVGTGSWQTFTSSFRPTIGISNARLDIQVDSPSTTVLVDDVTVVAPSSASEPAKALLSSSGLLLPAHHPNRGADSTQPNSLYARIAADSDRVSSGTSTVSTYLATGSDLKLPAGATITAGTTVRVRTAAWLIEELSVARMEGTRMVFSSPTQYPLLADWGYYLLGQKWMLDSAGEWFHDRSNGLLYAWMPNSAAPSSAVTVAYHPVGIDIHGLSYITIDGVRIRHVKTGINMRQTVGTTVRNAIIEDVSDIGIDGVYSSNGLIESNRVSRTGGDAISLADDINPPSTGMRVLSNQVLSSGVVMVGNDVVSLPDVAHAAIRAGTTATVSQNTVQDSAFLGIRIYAGSTASGNYVSGSCSVLDDCGGIYTNGQNNNSVISGNIVAGSRGALPGKPASIPYTQGQGIFLDNWASGVTVSGNTVYSNDKGIQLHVAANNVVQGNKLYGNRESQVWLQETSNIVKASGDVYGNAVQNNQFVPTSPTALAFLQTTIYGSTEAFSSYNGNRYFDRVYPMVGSERPATATADYTLPQWQAAKSATGTPRNLDITGSGASQGSYAANLATGSSIVPNGLFATALTGWTTWNQIAPLGVASRQTCAAGLCLRYAAGGSAGLVSSPNFSITKDTWYRISFDLATSADGQTLGMVVRRGGGGSNSYESLMAAPPQIRGTVAMKRYSFLFKALKTVNANDPLTLDMGARLDFEKINPGTVVSIGNVEIVPSTAVDTSVRADILVNTTAAAADMACPVAATMPSMCSVYVRLSDDVSVAWPYRLAARSSEIIYTLDRSLLDSDGDGVADSQDRCSATTAGLAVNAIGCALGQLPL